LINEVRFLKDKSSATNRFRIFLDKEINPLEEKFEAIKINYRAKNVP